MFSRSKKPRSIVKLRQRAFYLLFACLLTVGMGQSLFFIILPPIARNLGLSETQVSLIFTLSAILWSIFSPFWGRKSDQIGRKPIILAGLLGFAVSTALFPIIIMQGLDGSWGIMTIFASMIMARMLFGFLGSGSVPATNAYIADRTKRKDRVSKLAAVGASFEIGRAVGPPIAGFLILFGAFVAFWSIAGLAFLAAVAVVFFLTERTPPQRDKKHTKVHLTDKRIVPFLIIGVALSFCHNLLQQTLTFYVMDSFAMKSIYEATQYAAGGFAMMAMATIFVQLAILQRFSLSVRTLLIWGAIICFASMTLVAFSSNYAILLVALALAGAGFGLLRAAITAGASLAVSLKEQGGAAGFVGGTGAAGVVFVPVFATPLYQINPSWPYMLGSAIMLIILLYIFLNSRFSSGKQQTSGSQSPDS